MSRAAEREQLSCCLTKQQIKPDGLIYGQLAVCCERSATDSPSVIITAFIWAQEKPGSLGFWWVFDPRCSRKSETWSWEFKHGQSMMNSWGMLRVICAELYSWIIPDLDIGGIVHTLVTDVKALLFQLPSVLCQRTGNPKRKSRRTASNFLWAFVMQSSHCGDKSVLLLKAGWSPTQECFYYLPLFHPPLALF